MYKLFERKGRCLKALKQYPRALEAMKSAEMWMKYSTLSEAKSSSFKKEINKQVEGPEFKQTWVLGYPSGQINNTGSFYSGTRQSEHFHR